MSELLGAVEELLRLDARRTELIREIVKTVRGFGGGRSNDLRGVRWGMHPTGIYYVIGDYEGYVESDELVPIPGTGLSVVGTWGRDGDGGQLALLSDALRSDEWAAEFVEQQRMRLDELRRRADEKYAKERASWDAEDCG